MTRSIGIAGKVALVTGAARGIGAAVVEALHEEGAIVIACDIDQVALQGLANQYVADKIPVHTVQLDVRDSDAVNQCITDIEQTHGPIQYGVSVAGVLSITMVTDTTDDAWNQVFAVNTNGVFHVSRALARVMIPRKSGSLVTVSSNAAGIPRHAMAAYAASKAASTMFTRCLGLELAPHGIRCNIVAPGSTRTRMQESMWADASGEAAVIAGSLDMYKTGIPLRKIAEPRDVADAVLFLLSDRASHITMADLYVDGGATLRA